MAADASKRRAVVLHGVTAATPRPDEADTMVQVAEVAAALRELGYGVRTLPVSLDLRSLSGLAEQPPDVIFNLVESLAGYDRLIHLVPCALEAHGLSFTGSPGQTLLASSDKPLAKRLMRAAGLPTPDWVGAGGADRLTPGLRYIVKSASDHASFGLDSGSVVDAEGVGAALAARRRRFGGDWFAERYIEGREFNISIVETDGEPEVLPVAEMTFVDFPPGVPHIVDYAAKWDEQSPAYRNTVRRFDFTPDDSGLLNRLEALAEACWRCLGVRGYARVDIRVDESGNPHVLEVNANPCLSLDAGFMAAAERAGLGQTEVVGRLISAQSAAGRCELAAE